MPSHEGLRGFGAGSVSTEPGWLVPQREKRNLGVAIGGDRRPWRKRRFATDGYAVGDDELNAAYTLQCCNVSVSAASQVTDRTTPTRRTQDNPHSDSEPNPALQFDTPVLFELHKGNLGFA